MSSKEEILFEKMNRAQQLQAEINLAEAEVRRLGLELKDVLTDVETPEVSEDEDGVQSVPERTPHFEMLKRRLLSVSELPRRRCEYGSLYQREEYRTRARRKMKLLRKEIKSTNIEDLMEEPLYEQVLNRIRTTYPHCAGRWLLNELVALHCVLNADIVTDSSSSDNE